MMSIEDQFENLYDTEMIEHSRRAHNIISLMLERHVAGKIALKDSMFSTIYPTWSRKENEFAIFAELKEESNQGIAIFFNSEDFKIYFKVNSGTVDIAVNPILYEEIKQVESIFYDTATKIEIGFAETFCNTHRFGKLEEVFEEFYSNGVKFFAARSNDGNYETFIEDIPLQFPNITSETMLDYLDKLGGNMENIHIL